MSDFLSLIIFVIGGGVLAYFFFSAVAYFINCLSTSQGKNQSLQTFISSNSRSTPNMLMDLDKQLHEMNFQVVPDALGNFDTGVVQSLIDNKIIGKYKLDQISHNDGIYTVNISDQSYGTYTNQHIVTEKNNTLGVPDAISKMLFDEFLSIIGRQAKSEDHPYFKDDEIAVADGVVLASKKLVVKHNHVGDEKLDIGRTFKVFKNDIIIPIKNSDEKFLSYQVINKNKAKNIRIASSIKGGFFPIGKFPSKEKQYILCEDYLSGMVLHTATKKTVLVCFDVQNIPDVARSLLFKDRDSKFIFATAKDVLTKNQSRIKKGLQYSSEFNMPFIFPVFPSGKSFEQYKSWYELRRFIEEDKIRQMIETQVEYFNRVGMKDAISQVEQKFKISYE